MNTPEMVALLLFGYGILFVSTVRKWMRHTEPWTELAPWMAVYGGGLILIAAFGLFTVLSSLEYPTSAIYPLEPPLSWIMAAWAVLLALAVLVFLMRWSKRAYKGLWQRMRKG